MNKLAIPALLVATVMVAGAFAFMPIEQASTVHSAIIPTLDAGSIVRSETFLNVGTGIANFDGRIIYSLADGEVGVFTIEKLLICDLQVSGGEPQAAFSVEATLAQWTGATGNLIHEWADEKVKSEFGSITDEVCYQILVHNDDTGTIYTLSGDEDHDIVVHLFEDNDTMEWDDAETDGATLIAYISGIPSINDINVANNLN